MTESKKGRSEEIPNDIVTRKDEITSEFIRLADQHLDDLLQSRVHRKFHAKDFGAMLFIHPRHLTNTIKLTTGKSPCDIMEEKMITAAKDLLLSTNKSVSDIGYQLGYNDSTNFIKFFKGLAGISPLQFRKQQQGKI